MTDDLHKRLIQAIADPGHWTPRGDDYTESIPSWGARAVPIALGLEQIGWQIWEDPESDEWLTVELDWEDLHHFPHKPIYILKGLDRG